MIDDAIDGFPYNDVFGGYIVCAPGFRPFLVPKEMAKAWPGNLVELGYLSLLDDRWLEQDTFGDAGLPTQAKAIAEALQRRAADFLRDSRARAARGREAARQPRPTRQHPARAAALKAATQIRANRPGLSMARQAELVIDRLMADGIEPPSVRTIRELLQKVGT